MNVDHLRECADALDWGAAIEAAVRHHQVQPEVGSESVEHEKLRLEHIRQHKFDEMQRDLASRSTPYVYFIGGDVGCIKIGTSIAPQSRLKTLHYSSPVPLRIMALVEGDRQVEKLYHDRFAEHRRHGEWFDRAPELLETIEELAA